MVVPGVTPGDRTGSLLGEAKGSCAWGVPDLGLAGPLAAQTGSAVEPVSLGCYIGLR